MEKGGRINTANSLSQHLTHTSQAIPFNPVSLQLQAFVAGENSLGTVVLLYGVVLADKTRGALKPCAEYF